jgi:glycosyltransferase involved in cell wall biosynthesis
MPKKKGKNISMAIIPKEVTNIEIENFRKRFGIKDNSIVLLVQAFTASERKAKGVELVINSLKEIKKNIPNVLLVLTREGEFSKKLQEFAKKKGLSDNIIFTGDLKNGIVPLEVCDVFLWPWLGDSGFGLALLEAMLIKKPIVATSVTGKLPPLINNENALIINPDEHAIFEAVLKLLNDKQLAIKFGEKARKTVLENYTWEKVIKKFVELYNLQN